MLKLINERSKNRKDFCIVQYIVLIHGLSFQYPFPLLALLKGVLIKKPMLKWQRSSKVVDTMQKSAWTAGEYYFVKYF